MYKIKTKGKGKKIVKLFRKLGYGIDSDIERFAEAEAIAVNTKGLPRFQIWEYPHDFDFDFDAVAKEITYKQLNQMVRDKEAAEIEEIDYYAIKKEAKDRFVGLQEDIVALDREIELQLQQKIINLEHKLKGQKDVSQLILKSYMGISDQKSQLIQEIKDKDKIIIRQKEEIEELRLGL